MPDRHARHRRSAADRRRRPVDGYRMTSAERFDRLVDDAVSGLPDGLLRYLTDIQVAVAEVPPDADAAEVVLARLRRLGDGRRTRGSADPAIRLTLYRRPLEARAASRSDLLDLVQLTIVQELADHFGIDDDRLDDFGWS
ncbi:metallopeptidase family protein [Egicoccus sp. AB-alg2]|uniref:metallopeptidase family protein n=1 Tax=Egicoccus sp. AB-alg2 TaxID=3242693 RepID=UPI00359E76E5